MSAIEYSLVYISIVPEIQTVTFSFAESCLKQGINLDSFNHPV